MAHRKPVIRRADGRHWIAASLMLGLLAADARGADGDGIVDYYPGKDETCLEAEARSLLVDLRRMLVVVDVYGPDDREVSCTLEVAVVGDPNDELKLSASAHRCHELLEQQHLQRWKIEVVDDHLCGLAAE